VNCATLHGDGAASTLFGHRKGAFTGAVTDRAGLLRTAHEGVLFLDEIGELGLDEQAMLLKAVEEKRFFPMGSDREASSDFQLIAGTNRDLRVDVARRTVLRDGRVVDLTLKEYSVLVELLRADGATVSAEDLLERVWDENADPFTNAVRVTMVGLRRKLGEPAVIETLRGAGYRLVAP